jgi:hypothetical protein
MSGVVNERSDYIFLCENGDCLCQATLSLTRDQYKTRFYFAASIACPNCSRKMYEITKA